MITKEQVREAALLIPEGISYDTRCVDAGWEFVGTGCYYQSDDKRPLCMVGWLLDKFGLLSITDGYNNEAIQELPGINYQFDEDAIGLMTAYQEQQDRFTFRPWVQIAREVA